MPKFTVMKQKVYIVEAADDAEANNIVANELSTGVRADSEEAFFAAEYTKVYVHGVGEAVASLSLEYDPEKDECRRVTGYVDS